MDLIFFFDLHATREPVTVGDSGLCNNVPCCTWGVGQVLLVLFVRRFLFERIFPPSVCQRSTGVSLVRSELGSHGAIIHEQLQQVQLDTRLITKYRNS